MSSVSSDGQVTNATAAPQIPAGSVIGGKYRIDGVLGIGGMGTVYEGRHLLLDQRIAIKVLRTEKIAAREHVARFAREARAAAAIESPHIVRVMDVGALENGTPFMVLEHLRGSDLARLLKDRGDWLGIEEACGYVLEACEALAEAHRKGIVHRDLKPSNLFLARRPDGSDIVKVLDFGVSKFLPKTEVTVDAAGDFQTNTAAAIGSPQYMSPEQLRDSRTVDQRADIWALGIVLYRLLTKKHAFFGETQADLVVSILLHDPERPRTLRPELPEALEAAILKCLGKNPDDRFADVGGLAEALAPFAPNAAQSVERIRRTLLAMMSTPPIPMGGDESSDVEIHTMELVSATNLTTNAAAATVTGESLGFPAGVPKPNRIAKIAAAAGAVLGLAGAVLIAAAVRTRETTPPVASAPPPATSSAQPASTQTVIAPPEATPEAAPPASVAVATSASAIAPPKLHGARPKAAAAATATATATKQGPGLGDIPSYGGRK